MDMTSRLLISSENGDVSTINKLLRQLGAVVLNINIKDGLGLTPLAKASKGGHVAVVRSLLDAKAQVNSQDGVGITPLHLAVRGNHTEVVKLLVLNGAWLEAKNLDGLKPIDFAKHNSEIWDILHDAMLGDMPEIEEISDVPVIPDFALADRKKKKGSAKGKKGKGKKGKKGGKKKGKKKKRK